MHCTARMLGIISLSLGALSAVMLSLSFATDYWLKTKELTTDRNHTVAVFRHFGFWRICTYDIAFQSIAPMPGFSLVLLVIGFIVSACGYLKKDMKTIVAAVIYITSGMILALGIILYISTLNDEMNHVPPAKGDNPPMFSYEYGWSFMFCGSAYVCSQIAAMCQISLYLRRHADVEDMIRLIPGLEHKVDLILQRDVIKERDLDFAPSTSHGQSYQHHHHLSSIGTTI
ncbi:voltage-dependent calcium channel gamma-7 subunit-like [Tubulanus polymorphus]|uniref:voltage-dependent calcium channel gamma-7 subunit-like n=1 Tax=Tubulanus polymorphus TaxID=672921 RepID=UPI003DA25148